MGKTRLRLALACVAIVAAAIGAAGGSAGNRNGEGTLVAVPGPGAVTYGENIAYQATFTNLNTSGSVFTQTKFVMAPPVGPGGAEATPERASCGSFDANNVLTCEFGQLQPGDTLTLTVVWKAPAGASQPGCSECLIADGTWLIKEGKQTNANESFPVQEKAALLGVNDIDPTLSSLFRAGGYELEGCDTDNPTSLTTATAIDAATNPVVSSFCLPASFQPTTAGGGVASTITEPSGGPNFARQSEVCIAAPGQNCPGGTPATFGGEFITFTFKVAADALPSGYKITQVFHNTLAQPLPMCGTPEAATSENGCVVSITPPKGPPKIWTIVAKAKTNGPWNW